MTDYDEDDVNPQYKDVIDKALAHWDEVTDASTEYRSNAVSDLEFYAGEQWDWQAKNDRINSGAPAQTYNRLPSFVHQITNEQKQNRPSIQIDPVDNNGDVDTAQIIAGMIKGIEYDSNAETAYDKAFENAVIAGEGYWRIVSEYLPDSFDQVLKIKPIANTLSVLFDPNSKEIDGSDGDYCFIMDVISRTEFENKYPDSKIIDQALQSGWDSFDDGGWITDTQVRIAEYYCKEWKHETLYLVNDVASGESYTTKIKPTDQETNLVIVKERKALCPYVQWYKINGHEVLEHTEWPGQWLPVIPCKGEEIWVNGRREKWGLVRFLKEPQKAYNFMKSLQMELVGLQPKIPFIGAVGQFAGKEHEWRNANTTSYAYLEYNAIDVEGTALPAPQRTPMGSVIQDVTQTSMGAADDIKSIAGIFDPSLGEQGNEQSGKAILARQRQTSTGNLHYMDNLNQSLKHTGRILVDIMPKYYDTARMVRIVKPDSQQEVVAINQYDKGKLYDLSVGMYDVRVETGPSYATKRQENVVSMMALIQADPQTMLPLIGGKVVGMMDFPEAQNIAKILATQMPPEATAADGDSMSAADAEAQLQQAQSAIKQMQQALQQLNAHAGQIETELKNEKEENKLLKLKSGVELTKANQDYDIKKEEIALSEHQTKLEFILSEQKLEIEREKLEIEKQKIAITATNAMTKIEEGVHDRAMDHIDRTSGMQAALTASEPISAGASPDQDDIK